MNKEEFLKAYDEAYPKFEWFIKRYQPSQMEPLTKHRKDENTEELLVTLNEIWFDLPDHIFNIRENPPGWNEFLSLIED